MGVQILIADVDAYDPALPGVVTLRFATQGYATGPADSPAHTFYDGRIVQRPTVTRSLGLITHTHHVLSLALTMTLGLSVF